MNEELTREVLTREVLEAMKKCDETGCSECLAVDVCCSEDDITIGQRLATALLEERAKPKDDVWKNSPDWAKGACVIWDDGEGQKYTRLYNSERYTRELPKTRVDEIVKETREKIRDYLFAKDGQKSSVIDEILKSALTKYAEELEGNE